MILTEENAKLLSSAVKAIPSLLNKKDEDKDNKINYLRVFDKFQEKYKSKQNEYKQAIRTELSEERNLQSQQFSTPLKDKSSHSSSMTSSRKPDPIFIDLVEDWNDRIPMKRVFLNSVEQMLSIDSYLQVDASSRGIVLTFDFYTEERISVEDIHSFQ
jgi:hypothetical protein